MASAKPQRRAPAPSRPPHDAARTLERSAAIDEDRLFGPARANTAAPGTETQTPERSGGAAPSIQPANDDRQSAGEILRAFQSRSNRVPTAFVAACPGLWVILILGYFIANRAVLFDLPAGPCYPRLHFI